MGGMYHITMLVSEEQEDAIRSLFRDKNWTCCIQALSNNHIECLKQDGYSDIFFLETPENLGNELYKEIKTEITGEEDNDLSDTQNLDDSEITPNPANHDDESQDSVKLENTSSPVEDREGYSQSFDEPINLSSTSADANDDTVHSDMVQNTLTDEVVVDKILVPNPAYLMIYANGNSQLVGSEGQPVGNIIQPMGSISQPAGNVKHQSRHTIKRGRKISQRVHRELKPVRYDTMADPDTESDAGPECSVCGERFKTKASLKKHFKHVHVGFLDHGCNDCTERYETEKELLKHRKKEHPELETVAKQPEEPKKKPTHKELIAMGYLECPVCHNAFINQKSLRAHLRNIHAALSWTCDVCGDVYSSYHEYCQHTKATGHQTSKSMLGSYMCETCGKILNRYDKFKEHKKLCSLNDGRAPEEMKKVPCEVCGAMFKTELQVYSHKRYVHLVDPITCEICGATMKNKRALMFHRARHDPKRKKYACDECDKSFLKPSILKQHKYTHTKEKPFKCPMCNYRCAARNNLSKHANAVHKNKATAVSESNELSTPVDYTQYIPMDSYMQ